MKSDDKNSKVEGANSNMEHLSVAQAAALPSAALPFSPVRQASMSIPGGLVSDQADQLLPGSSLDLGARQMYSKEQWEAQKPVIWRLYNEENKPFKRVIEILRKEYNFVPTYVFPVSRCLFFFFFLAFSLFFKFILGLDLLIWVYSNSCYRRRQFYRKISEWGYEKNIKESEMRAIAENFEIGETGGPIDVKGRQIDTAKIQRWQKRQGRMKRVVNASQAHSAAGECHGSQTLD
jgi:hypothetical protein